jgi:hypothetical protein
VRGHGVLSIGLVLDLTTASAAMEDLEERRRERRLGR